jgi:hypothetical protein
VTAPVAQERFVAATGLRPLPPMRRNRVPAGRWRQNRASTGIRPPNMLKKRVLLSSGEFHSGSKRATRAAMEQCSLGWVLADIAAAGSQFEV